MNKISRNIFLLIKPYLALEFLGLLLTVLYTLCVFATPLASRYLIDDVLPNRSREGLLAGIGIFVAVMACQPTLGFAKDYLFRTITEKITYDLRTKLYGSVLRAPMTFFDTAKGGEVVSRIVNDGIGVSKFISSIFISLIKDVFMIVMILAGMFMMSARISLLILGVYALFFFLKFTVKHKFRKISLDIQQNNDAMCVAVSQTVTSIATIKTFLSESYFLSRFDLILSKSLNDNRRYALYITLVNNLSSLLMVVCLSITYGYGTWLVMSTNLTLGAVISLSIYIQQLISPVNELINSYIEYQRIVPILGRIAEYDELSAEDRGDGRPSGPIADIRFKDVHFAYGNSKILNGVCFHLPGRGKFAFIGPSGGGKSTLIKLILGLYAPQSGEIIINSRDIRHIGVARLREQIGYISQEIDLYNASILENIRCGNAEIGDEAIKAACQRLKLDAKISSLDQGYHTIINERINLSGGERQRVAIARILVRNPSLYIFDEPTSALDPENERIITELLDEIAEDRMVIVIAHRLHTIENADKLFYLENGHLTEFADYWEFTRNHTAAIRSNVPTTEKIKNVIV
ncbi:ABC transporter ATP-binding protein [Paenibacillus sp. A14]|uniref:ABC transporter ATP-binding protein n=1 Tax=Paenibacillus sp. A14 TaxID=3119820 RepID=UPI002FE37394